MKASVHVLVVGLNRSLSYTAKSINHRLIDPLKRFPLFDLRVHTFLIQPQGGLIDNPRSGESGPIETSMDSWDHPTSYLKMDELLYETEADRAFLSTRPDRLQDERKSEGNALLFLRALSSSFEALRPILENSVVVLCRPDVSIEGSLRIRLMVATAALATVLRFPLAFLPEWAKFRGLNDRFAVMSGPCVRPYFTRINLLQELVPEGEPFHSESFLKKALERCSTWSVIKTPMVRIRIGGKREKDDESLADRLRWRRRVGVWLVRIRRALRGLAPSSWS